MPHIKTKKKGPTKQNTADITHTTQKAKRKSTPGILVVLVATSTPTNPFNSSSSSFSSNFYFYFYFYYFYPNDVVLLVLHCVRCQEYWNRIHIHIRRHHDDETATAISTTTILVVVFFLGIVVGSLLLSVESATQENKRHGLD
jgi:hypothetical protein